MKTRIMASLSFDTITKRDNVANAVSTRIAGYSMFEVILSSGLDELGRPQLTIDLRTNKDIDGSDIYSWAKNQLDNISIRPIASSISIHRCSHDEVFQPCKLIEVKKYP